MTNRAEELITQLEAEIAKRDARIAELEASKAAADDMFRSLGGEIYELNAKLAALKAGQGDPIAYRWAWKESREDDGWTYRETLPSNPKACIIQPLYTAPPAPPASADAVSVPVELLERAIRCMGEKSNHRETHATKYATADELRALLVQS